MIITALLLLPGVFILGLLVTRLCLLPVGMQQKEFRRRCAIARALAMVCASLWLLEIILAMLAVVFLDSFLLILSAGTSMLELWRIWLFLGLLGAQALPFYLGYRFGYIAAYFGDLNNWSRSVARGSVHRT